VPTSSIITVLSGVVSLTILSARGVDISSQNVVFFHLSNNGFEMLISAACSLNYARQ
jgi:hypothetical protein